MPLHVLLSFFLVISIACCEKKTVFSWDHRKLQLKLARNPEEKSKGLQGHPPLRSNEGMLFIYKKSKRLSFWMKDVSFPIDLAYFDKRGRIVAIEHLKAYDLKAIPSPGPVRFVLEMPLKWFERENIKTGDR
jgi:uncharacterized membrane protein (UPF0127 family)